MKVFYDFHIHSCLSPCANDDMTPVNIVAMASVKGLNVICVSDHNAIENVQTAMACGEAFGVTVIPAIEVQTAEDIHVLAMFSTFKELADFFNSLKFPPLQNDSESFGNQYIVDEDNNTVGEVERMLLVGSYDGIYDICDRIINMGGKAVLAHIDREANGILAILGCIPEDLHYSAIEFSTHASTEMKKEYAEKTVVTDSDAHRLEDISDAKNSFESDELSVENILKNLFK